MQNKFEKKTLIVAHRGASHVAPENTLPSFELAFRENADFIEGDFRLTKDGRVVCIHDALTKRTAPNQKNMRVSKRNYKELLELDFGSWKGEEYSNTKIPTLEEILNIIPKGKGIVIEIKEDKIELVNAIKEIIEASKVPLDKIIIISFHSKVIVNAIRLIKNVKTFWLYEWHYTRTNKKCIKIEMNIIKTLKMLNCTGIDINVPTKLSERFIKMVRENKFELFTYTIDSHEQALELFNLGVDGITTNSPGSIRKILLDKTVIIDF